MQQRGIDQGRGAVRAGQEREIHVGDLFLGALVEVGADIDAAHHRVVQRLVPVQASGLDGVLLFGDLQAPVMVVVLRIPQVHRIGIGHVRQPEMRIARRGLDVEIHALRTQPAGVELQRGLVALGPRVTQVRGQGAGLGDLEDIVPSHREQLVLALVAVVAHDRLDAVEGAAGDHRIAVDVGGLGVAVGHPASDAGERGVVAPHRAVGGFVLVELGVVQV